MRGSLLRAGEVVLLVDSRGRRHLKSLSPHHRITIRGSVLRCDDLIGQPEGTIVGAGEPESFLAFRPSHAQLVPEIERPAEPIFPKDVGAIVVYADIRAGDRVVEIGTGAGALSIALLRSVGPAGRVASYEIRPDFAEVASKTVRTYEPAADHWRLVVADARNGVTERDVDAVVLDVPDPVPLLAVAAAALRPGGALAVYVPTTLQLKDLRDALAARGDFAMVETVELLERPWHAEPNSLRPAHRMVAHTAFLTFARRTAQP
jgi:tRNA (adenine57-N1/adenine58-N1)-methyltransferase